MKGPEAMMARSSIYNDNRIPGGRTETNPFTATRNSVTENTALWILIGKPHDWYNFNQILIMCLVYGGFG